MSVTWSKETITRRNPFDDVDEIVIDVYDVTVSGTLCPKELYTFPNGTADATIQSQVEADLISKGYQI